MNLLLDQEGNLLLTYALAAFTRVQPKGGGCHRLY